MADGILRKIAARFGVAFDTTALNSGIGRINAGAGALRTFAQQVTDSAIVRGVREFAEGFERDASALQDTSDRLGVTTTQLQELNHAARMSGVSSETMGAALTRLTDALGNTGGAASPASRALTTLGIAARDASGQTRSANDVMTDIAEAMGRVEDPSRRVALSMDLFGRSGTRLTGVLTGGSQGLAAMRAEFHALGGGLDDASVHAGADFGDSMDRLNVVTDGFRALLARDLLPVLTRTVNWFTRMSAVVHHLVDGTHVVRVALVGLAAAAAIAGAAMIAAWLPTLAPVLLAAAGIAAMVLIVDDLIGLFSGGRSAIGEFIDGIFGIGTAGAVVKTLRNTFHQVADAIDGVLHRLHLLHDATEDEQADAGQSAADRAQTARIRAQRAAMTPAQLEAFDAAGAAAGAHQREKAATAARVVAAAAAHPVATVRAAHAALGGASGTDGIRPSRSSAAAGSVVHQHTSSRTLVAPIHIHDATDPRAVGRVVRDVLMEHERTLNDADDPRAGRE